MSAIPNQGKLLALDVGLRRIGIAVCDPLRLVARPLKVINRSSRRADFAQLARLVSEHEIVAVICGLPLYMDGNESEQTRTTRKWAERLAHALRTLLGRPIPIQLWDERLTTFAAQELMTTLDLDASEDAVAAAVILQDYLDTCRRQQSAQTKERLPVGLGQILLPPQTTSSSKSS